MKKETDENPNKYDAFASFVESISDYDPAGLEKMSDLERLNFLDTREEQQQFIASLVARNVLQEIKGVFINGTQFSEAENNILRLELGLTSRQIDSVDNKIYNTLQIMTDSQKLEKHFEFLGIEDKSNFDFDLVHIPESGTQGPDHTGFQIIIEQSQEIATIELDRRIKKPISNQYSKARYSDLFTKTGQDLTGVSYLSYFVLPRLERNYNLSLQNLRFLNRNSREEVLNFIHAMSYPAALFCVDIYRDVVDEFLAD